MSKRKRDASELARSFNKQSRRFPSIGSARKTVDPDEPLPSIETYRRANTVASFYGSQRMGTPRAGSQYHRAHHPETPMPGVNFPDSSIPRIPYPGSYARPHYARDQNVDAQASPSPSAADDAQDHHSERDDSDGDSDDGEAEETIGPQKSEHQVANDKSIYAAVKTIKKGKNVFVTGPAGSGKSYFIQKLVALLQDSGKQDQPDQDAGNGVQDNGADENQDEEKKKKKAKRIEIIAPTGTAALNVGGRTCHQFFGLTPNTTKRPLDEVLEVADQLSVKQRLQDVDVLVIDEISMVSNEFFQQMDQLMRKARHMTGEKRKKNCDRKKPFGGVTVVAVGDFAQLGPVLGLAHCMYCGEERTSSKRGTVLSCSAHGVVNDEDKWAFRSPTWIQLKFTNILLQYIIRQQTDDFQELVNTMWLGNKLTKTQLDLLKEERTLPAVTTHLYTRRTNAAEHNASKFAEITEPTARYVARDTFKHHHAHDNPWIANLARRRTGTNFLQALENHRYSDRLELKVGMPVILLQNIDVEHGLVNGSQGKITGWSSGDPMNDTKYAVTGSSDPLGYNWQDTHGHVTRDWVPSLRGNYQDTRDEEIRQYILEPANRGRRWPVVTFNNGVTRPIVADCSAHEVRYQQRASLLMRTQIPLMAGWALTIHKAQGMTLDAVVVNVEGSFDPGQEYVAISRARTIQGLEIHGLQHNGLKYRTPEVVRDFLMTSFPQLRQRMEK